MIYCKDCGENVIGQYPCPKCECTETTSQPKPPPPSMVEQTCRELNIPYYKDKPAPECPDPLGRDFNARPEPAKESGGREWWIKPTTRFYGHDFISTQKMFKSPTEEADGYFHVIEYGAFEQMKRERDDLIKRLEPSEETVESALGEIKYLKELEQSIGHKAKLNSDLRIKIETLTHRNAELDADGAAILKEATRMRSENIALRAELAECEEKRTNAKAIAQGAHKAALEFGAELARATAAFEYLVSMLPEECTAGFVTEARKIMGGKK